MYFLLYFKKLTQNPKIKILNNTNSLLNTNYNRKKNSAIRDNYFNN